jgi:outer membrane protein OmpA-like peptidoglycan-associated protein
MTQRALTSILALAVALVMGVAAVAEAQVGSIIRRAGRAVNDEIGREIERLMREGVRCAFNDDACIRDARSSGKTPIMTDSHGNVITDKDGRPMTDPAAAAAKVGPAQAARPGEGAWTNFDFVPGERVLFYDDYTDDTVGDFPRPFDFIAGNWEVVEWQGQRYIRGTTGGAISVKLPEVLPERFTIEFPASVQHGNGSLRVSTAPIDHGRRDFAGSAPSLRFSDGGLQPIKRQGPEAMSRRRDGARGEALVTFRVMADGNYMKVYLDDHRVANVPNAIFPRTDTLYVTIAWAYDENPVMIGPMRIAAGGRDLYDRLEAEGRVATQGIYFAVNSDVIRPESTGTLKAIGAMLTKHPDLRLSIEGHTDSDGDDAHNLDLSRRRAEAVKAHLVRTVGIDAGRLETAGLGETKPAADNATPAGKQQNRRVELVKIGG